MTLKDIAEQRDRFFNLVVRAPTRFNNNYRLRPGRDVRDLLYLVDDSGAAVDPKMQFVTDALSFYANGETPQDRPGVMAVFHPIIHRDDWANIFRTARDLAIKLQRWIWLTIGEDRWCRIMVGDNPHHGDDHDEDRTGPLYVDGKYQNDQYITTFSPTGEEHLVGCS